MTKKGTLMAKELIHQSPTIQATHHMIRIKKIDLAGRYLRSQNIEAALEVSVKKVFL